MKVILEFVSKGNVSVSQTHHILVYVSRRLKLSVIQSFLTFTFSTSP